MKLKKIGVGLFASSILATSSAFAEVNLSGFASINVGRVMSGTGLPEFGIARPTFLADFPNVSTYEDEWDMEPETLFGLQVDAELADGLSATAQFVSRGADQFDVDIEWLYLSYEINDNWTLQAGRKRLPLFYYSDFFDVGYAYVWMRPAADNYTWQIMNYNGVNALYNTELGDWSISTNFYIGKEDDRENKLQTFYFGIPVREIWSDMIGGVVQVNRDWFELRTTYMSFNRNVMQSTSEPNPDREQDMEFYGMAVNLDFDSLFVLTELNRLASDGLDRNTLMLTLGYRLDDITPYASYANFRQDPQVNEKHKTISLGVRWDFHHSAAFKVQYDDVEDESRFTAGDAKVITFGVDLVF